MNLVNNIISMNSQQIAELTNKRHDNVKRTIETLFNKGIIQRPQSEVIKNDRNQDLNVFIFEGEIGKRDSIVVVAQIMPEVTAILVDRWQELEEAAAIQVTLPTTYLEALKALLSSEEQKQVIQHQLEEAAPKINHYDTVVDRTGLVIATSIGNKLGISATKLNRLLDDLDVYNKRTNKRAFKQWFINEGYGIAKQAHMGFNQCLFTLKGEAWIVEQLTMAKAVPDANIERIAIRRQHTESVIDLVNNLLVY